MRDIRVVAGMRPKKHRGGGGGETGGGTFGRGSQEGGSIMNNGSIILIGKVISTGQGAGERVTPLDISVAGNRCKGEGGS